MTNNVVRPRLHSIVLVSLYLFLVGVWLLVTKRISSPGFGRLLRAKCRSTYRGAICAFEHEQGHCYMAPLPPELLSDHESASRIVVREDGVAIGIAHASHSDIRNLGNGRFSHWGDALYFSSSDNSDPRSNGRRYSVEER